MNIPSTKLDTANKILIIGLGGGFDIFTGLPFVFKYPDKKFVLANSSSLDTRILCQKSTIANYPEGSIEDINNVESIYTIGRLGTIALQKAYQQIIDEHQIDAILAVDGGVDSLAIGDEESNGTILEDFIALAALSEIKLPKIMCCAGFGTETEEDMNHYRILENIANLIKEDNCFYGSFSLTKEMHEFKKYVSICNKTWEDKRKSHIQTKIISAAKGCFGDDNIYKDIDAKVFEAKDCVFISALSNIFWMFDLDKVAAKNKALKALKRANTFIDCKMILREFLTQNEKRSKLPLPL